jgi:hypothetical protein
MPQNTVLISLSLLFAATSLGAAQLPLVFERNAGQAASDVLFVGRGGAENIALLHGGGFRIRGIEVGLAGANPHTVGMPALRSLRRSGIAMYTPESISSFAKKSAPANTISSWRRNPTPPEFASNSAATRAPAWIMAISSSLPSARSARTLIRSSMGSAVTLRPISSSATAAHASASDPTITAHRS